MADEIFDAVPQESVSAASQPPRELIEKLVHGLRKKNIQKDRVTELLNQLATALDRCFAFRDANALYDDAIQRAPWLTADAQRLRHQHETLRQMLCTIRALARNNDTAISSGHLVRQFNEFVELFLEHEAAEQNFLEAAFPGPDWAVES